jgi:beta-glucosidase
VRACCPPSVATPVAVRVDAARSVDVTIPLPARAFSHWQDGGWHYEPGSYQVLVGTSVEELPLCADIELVP